MDTSCDEIAISPQTLAAMQEAAQNFAEALQSACEAILQAWRELCEAVSEVLAELMPSIRLLWEEYRREKLCADLMRRKIPYWLARFISRVCPARFLPKHLVS